ncbi:hypothetical protein [Syntrophomonas erecta]
MGYTQHSFVFKILAGSWFLGWLFAPPADRSQVFAGSWFYRGSAWLVQALVKGLYRIGQPINRLASSSYLIQNPVGFIGLLVFFYFITDIIINPEANVPASLVIAFLAIVIPLLVKAPGIGKGTLIYRLFKWWIRTE